MPRTEADHPPNGALHSDEHDVRVIAASTKTRFDLSFLARGETEEVILLDRISLEGWAIVGASIRVHRIDLSPGAAYWVSIYGVSPSVSDGADFTTNGALATKVLVPTAPSLQQLTAPLQGVQTPFARVTLTATGPDPAPGRVYIELSCDIVLEAE